MADKWQWYAGAGDDDLYVSAPRATKKEVIDTAIEDGLFNEVVVNDRWHVRINVIEGIKWTAEDIEIDPFRVIEDLEVGPCADWLDPDGELSLFDVDDAAYKDLGRRLTAAFREWAKDKRMHVYDFKETRNAETVTVPHPQPPDDEVE